MNRKLGLLVIIVLIIAVGGVFVAHSFTKHPVNKTSRQYLTISGIVVPHHDLVKTQREQMMAKVAQSIKQPATIILVSPNHYEVGIGGIQVSDQTWNVTDGKIQPNLSVINALKGVAAVENGSFSNEHGIKLLLGDTKHYFPNSTIVPIILKRSVTIDQVNSLEKALTSSCHDCLLVDSVDFSHYQPALLANLHDNLSIRALENLDTSTLLEKSEVDSPAALALMVVWAKSHQTDEFHLDNHTNSDIINHSPDAEATSHVFGWYQSGAPVVPASSVSFTIGGDMMFGRSIAHTFLSGGLQQSLDQLGERVFWGTDAGIINLEGPISDKPVPDNTAPNDLNFNFPPQAIDALKFIKVNAASQANNHSGNAGQAGLDNTRSVLTSAGIQPIGGPNDADITRTAKFSGQGLNLYVIGVLELTSQPDLSGLIKNIKADPNNRVLIFPHWGSEYVQGHTDLQSQQAHAWVDAGADVVIGAHPHVIEDAELYKGRPIIYSLGNLLFDQTFSTATQQGLLISGEFRSDGLYIFGLPTLSTNYKPALMTGAAKASLLNGLYSPFKDEIKNSAAGEVLFFPNLSK